MGSGCGMNTVDTFSCNVDGTLEPKGHIGSPKVIVNRLWKSNDIQSFLTKQIGCLMRAVTAKDHETVKAKLIIVLLHGFYFI